MEKTRALTALKRFLERDDSMAPGGGRKVTMAELQQLSGEDRRSLGALAAAELGVELED